MSIYIVAYHCFSDVGCTSRILGLANDKQAVNQILLKEEIDLPSAARAGLSAWIADLDNCGSWDSGDADPDSLYWIERKDIVCAGQ